MDWDEYERNALTELECASTGDELSDAHVRWLGRRAELQSKRGMLARVVESGEVAVGDNVELV